MAQKSSSVDLDHFKAVVQIDEKINRNIIMYNQTVEQVHGLEDYNMKSFLYSLLNQPKFLDVMNVTKVHAVMAGNNPVPQPPKIAFNEEKNMSEFGDKFLNYSLVYKDETYEVSFMRLLDGAFDLIYDFMIYITGMTNGATKTKEVFDFIKKHSLTNSPLKNQILKYTTIEGLRSIPPIIMGMEIIEPPKRNLEDIFISEIKREQIKRFIYSMKHFHKDKVALRYLLNGQPGTGKTQLINAVVSEMKGKATVIFCQSRWLNLDELLKFCSSFELTLLVIDDLDLLVHDRRDNGSKENLAVLLQSLDGVIPSNLFMLASTNDKSLVDVAASRPGRFDLILDIGEIDSANYFSLINRETDDPEIINLFTKSLLNEFKAKRVTGAFIVSLIKQLTSTKKMNGSVDADKLNEIFQLTHSGHYSSNAENFNKAVGFM